MKKTILVFITMVLIATVTTVIYADELTAAQHFEMGAKLINDNHYDAMGGTDAGMEEGIFHVQEALRMGYPDKKRIYILLIDSYGQRQVILSGQRRAYLKQDSDEYKKAVSERNDYMQRLYQLDPNDKEVLIRYVSLTSEKEEKFRAYKRLAELYPKMAMPHAGMAYFFIEAGDVSQGIAELKVWLGLENDPSAVRSYVGVAVEFLAAKNCVVPSKDTWHRRFLKIQLNMNSSKFGVREQGQLSFATAKQEFLAALEKTKCHVPNKEDQLRAHKKLVEQYPKAGYPHLQLAIALIEMGDTRQGIAELEAWLEFENPLAAVAGNIRRTMQALEQKGCVVPDRNAWYAKLTEIEPTSKTGIHSVSELSEFKKIQEKARQEFSATLDKTKCP